MMSGLLPKGRCFYFGYASNMWSKRMRNNVKSSDKYANGLLKDWKLGFSGHSTRWSGATANLEPQLNERVWGVIWVIDDKELDLLNKQEFGYKRIEIDVSVEGRQEMVKCWTYVQKEHESDPRFNPDRSRKEPSLIYKMVILKGANEHQLPNDYIESIKAYPDNGIVDIDRNDGIPSICESELFSDNNNNNNVE